MYKGKWDTEDNSYWDNLGCAWWDDMVKGLDKSITIEELKHLDDGHIYAALFREIEAECPTTEAIAVYCFMAMESRYYNYMIADRYQPEAYRIFDEMFDTGSLDNRSYLKEEVERNGGNPSDHEGNPDIYEAVYWNFFERILKALGIKPEVWAYMK